MIKARILAATSAIVLVTSAGLAHAQTVNRPRTAPPSDAFTVRGDFDSRDLQLAQPNRKALQFDAKKGRWGLKLDLGQPTDRDASLRDIEAGAYFRITPQLRVGGAVGVGSDRDPPLRATPTPKEDAPRVRLEGAFKF